MVFVFCLPANSDVTATHKPQSKRPFGLQPGGLHLTETSSHSHLRKAMCPCFNTFIRENSKLKVGNHLRTQCSGVLWSTMFRKIFIPILIGNHLRTQCWGVLWSTMFRKIFIPILINVFRSQSVGHNLVTEHQQLFDRYPSKWFLVTHLLLQKIVWVM